jgi:alpha-mannosidase
MLGGSVEWSAVQDAVSVNDGNNSMTLAVVDAPLVSLADINRGHWPDHFIKSSATVFSYALNNYWFTNTPAGQSGDMTFRYAITSGGKFDAAEATCFGREARAPLEISQLRASDKLAGAKGRLPAGAASLASVEPAGVIINSLKGAEDGKGMIVRVYEAAGQAADGTLTLPWVNIAAANDANAVELTGKRLESDAHTVRFHIEPHQLLTLRVAF